ISPSQRAFPSSSRVRLSKPSPSAMRTTLSTVPTLIFISCSRTEVRLVQFRVQQDSAVAELGLDRLALHHLLQQPLEHTETLLHLFVHHHHAAAFHHAAFLHHPAFLHHAAVLGRILRRAGIGLRALFHAHLAGGTLTHDQLHLLLQR